ncbi:MAG: hypothetical protein M3389_01105, partial [Actinomycetota bacterium]|nr:hypothetical protein [Actinomycetota bacterium]
QSAVRDRVIRGRLVARFRSRRSSFDWDGTSTFRSRRVRNGYLFVRFRARTSTGADVVRVALKRSRGRFSSRPAFARRDTCAPLASFKLLQPAFGGRTARPIAVSYRLNTAGRVTLEVVEEGVVVQRFRDGDRPAGATFRRFVNPRPFIRGDVTFRLRVERDGRTEVAQLVARRI